MTDILSRLAVITANEKRPFYRRAAWVNRTREQALIALVQEAAEEIERLKQKASNWDYFEHPIKRLLTLDEAAIDLRGLKVGDSILDGIADYLLSMKPQQAT